MGACTSVHQTTPFARASRRRTRQAADQGTIPGCYHDRHIKLECAANRHCHIRLDVLLSLLRYNRGDLLGDTTRSKDKQHDLPGLRYLDIQLIVGKDKGISKIISKDNMRNTKGTK